MRRSSRLFDVIQVLRGARAPMPAHAIAAALEVSKRTIYRDIATLQAMRVPIEGEAGIGYVMRPGFDLPPLMFTAEEVEAIAVGLSLLGRTGDAGLLAAATNVRRKIADVLPGRGTGVDATALDRPRLHVSQWHAVPQAEIDHRLLRAAIREERKLSIRYRDAQERVTLRTVWPVALVYYVDSVVLAAWCELRSDFRHFRLDRMADCRAEDALFAGRGERLRREWSERAGLPARIAVS